jgi:hypothetical protein
MGDFKIYGRSLDNWARIYAGSGNSDDVQGSNNPADLVACSGLRPQLRLEQRLLRSKDGNELW